jgi:predicted transcriptional regulator
MTLGSQLRALRLTAGYSQAELSTIAQIGRTTISDVEREARPTTTDVVERWLNACSGTLVVKGIKEEDGPQQLAIYARGLDAEMQQLAARVIHVLGRVQGRERVVALRQLVRWLEDFELDSE